MEGTRHAAALCRITTQVPHFRLKLGCELCTLVRTALKKSFECVVFDGFRRGAITFLSVATCFDQVI
jgi:hypothetical protein